MAVGAHAFLKHLDGAFLQELPDCIPGCAHQSCTCVSKPLPIHELCVISNYIMPGVAVVRFGVFPVECRLPFWHALQPDDTVQHGWRAESRQK